MVNQGAYQYRHSSIQEETMALLPKAQRILDIGGGRGASAAFAKERTGAAFACVADISQDAIADRHPGVDAAAVADLEQEGAVERLFADQGPFDLVLCLDVLEHFVDPWRVVHRLHAALAPGGHILASIPNVQNYRAVIRSFTGTWRYKETGLFDRTHLRYFAKASAVELMTCTGLKLTGLGKAYGPSAWDRRLDKASFGLLGPWVTMQNIVRVEKVGPPERDPGFCGSAAATR